ncbi:acyl-CoA thioesterase domain-containing protein [Arthrobacter sp. NPDC058097]|uniref:acyl-CoA thioesterase domain-containing protein n=1 Tax=Arthrobacter sp. NPDC058097 TaxID=3346340 RepID=UPI0036DEE2AA
MSDDDAAEAVGAKPEPVPAFFRLAGGERGEIFQPLPSARSGWSARRLQGPATTGLLARAAQRCAQLARPDLQAARASFELFRPVRLTSTTTRARIVREGHRLLLVDSFLMQNGETVARAHIFFLAPSANPDGRIWASGDEFPPPPLQVRPAPYNRLYRSEDSQWSADPSLFAQSTRKYLWQGEIDIVENEAATGFGLIAVASDLASLVIHWGTRGVQFINAETTVSFSRLPSGRGVGVASAGRSAQSGISAGSAVLYDAKGAFGVATVTALAEAGHTILGQASPPKRDASK